MIVNVAVVHPAITVTDDGVLAAVLFEDRLTVRPPLDAGPVKVTVPVDESVPYTDVGSTLTLEMAGGVTVSTAVAVPFNVPVMVADWEVATAVVVIVKFAVVALPGTRTEVPGFAAELFEERVTEIPPDGAGPLSVTVPVEEVLPRTEVGKTDKLMMLGAVIVNGAD